MILTEDTTRMRKVRTDHGVKRRTEPRDPMERTPAQRRKDSRRFIGWDGEGFTLTNGAHIYGLFGNSDGARITNPRGVTYRQALELLFTTPTDSLNVIYAGTYDVTMLFAKTIWGPRIMSGAWVTIDDRWRIRFLRGKSLQVRDLNRKQSRTLFDVFTFFGTSFVGACREYLGPSDVLTEIAAMKQQRSTFTEITAEIDGYMSQELDLLVKLCGSLRDKLHAVNIYPTRWHGPGAVAGQVLRQQRINDHRTELPDELVTAAESAYYGGRFEMVRQGTFIGPVYQYDIRSAYPYAMTKLWSLTGCTWTHTGPRKLKRDQINPYALYRVRRQCTDPDQTLWSRVPHREPNGSITFPDWAYGWYWGIELPWCSTAVTESWTPNQTSGRPFGFVQDMYDERARLKADGKPEQLALKLALNSLYGKLAQSKGASYKGHGEWRKPTYHEAIWAGFITAHTRSQIQHAIRLAGRSLIAVETDAVFTTEPLPLDIGTRLGQWDETRYDGIKYMQSGVHMTLSDGEWSYKTRGVTMLRSKSDQAMWDTLLSSGSIDLTQTRFGTDPRQATFGRWYTQTRTLSLNIDNAKRIATKAPCAECDPTNPFDYTTHLHRLAVRPVPREDSTPYTFVWNDDLPSAEDDPTLFLSWEPDILEDV